MTYPTHLLDGTGEPIREPLPDDGRYGPDDEPDDTLLQRLLDEAVGGAPSLVTGPSGQVWDVRGKLRRNRLYALIDVGDRNDREAG